jgi:hypothetical protein
MSVQDLYYLPFVIVGGAGCDRGYPGQQAVVGREADVSAGPVRGVQHQVSGRAREGGGEAAHDARDGLLVTTPALPPPRALRRRRLQDTHPSLQGGQ